MGEAWGTVPELALSNHRRASRNFESHPGSLKNVASARTLLPPCPSAHPSVRTLPRWLLQPCGLESRLWSGAFWSLMPVTPLWTPERCSLRWWCSLPELALAFHWFSKQGHLPAVPPLLPERPERPVPESHRSTACGRPVETPALRPGSRTPPGPPLARPPPSLTSHARARRPLSSQSLNVGPSLPKGFALVFPPPGTLFPAPFCLASSQSITPQLKCHLPERPPSPPQPPPQLFRPLPHLCCAYSCLFVDLSTPKPHACSSGTGLSRVLLSATSMVPRQCLASRCLINVCLFEYIHTHTHMHV